MKVRSAHLRLARQRGLSLVEMMVALVIGLVLMAGVGQIYVNSKQTYRGQDTRARLQENARFAMELLTRSVREAGYMGCAGTVTLTNTLNLATGGTTHAYPYDYQYESYGYTADTRLGTIAAIHGFEWTGGASTSTAAGNWTPSLDASITSPSPGSDALTVRGPVGVGLRLTSTMANNADNPVVGANTLSQCDTVIVSNCAGASLMQITNSDPMAGTLSHGTAGCTPANNAAGTLASAYQTGDDVIPYGTTSFYVRTGASGEPALYRRINGNDAEELVEGVEIMQIRYGEDTDALPADPSVALCPLPYTSNFCAPNRYVTANQVADWRRVVSVRISLLMRTSDDNVVTAPQTYQFDGGTVTATDRRLRQIFTATIGVRNRLP